jgi:hypothetical protein
MGKRLNRPTQKDKVLRYIREFGKITSWDAYSQLGVTQLATRIFELKQDGYVFTKKRVNTLNRLQEKTHYDEYMLVEVEP